MYRQSEKIVKQQYLPYTSPHNMVNFGSLAAEIVSLVWGTPGNFNVFRVLAALQNGTLVVGVSQTAALNRGCHLYSAGRPSRWALAHISSYEIVSSAVITIFKNSNLLKHDTVFLPCNKICEITRNCFWSPEYPLCTACDAVVGQFWPKWPNWLTICGNQCAVRRRYTATAGQLTPAVSPMSASFGIDNRTTTQRASLDETVV